MLAVDEIVDHAALNRAGAIQRVQRREVFEARRLVAAQNIAHAMRFKLENGRRFSAGKKLVGGLVVQRQRAQIDFQIAVLLDHVHGVVQHGERRQAQEIHFEQADVLEALHVVLRRDFIPVGLVQRDNVGERLGRNHHAGRVRRCVSGKPFQALGHFHQILVARVAVDQALQLRRLFQRFVERDVQLRRDQLGDAIHFPVWQIHGAAHVFDGRFRRHGSEGDDLGHIGAAVLPGDVFDHFAAAPHAEVDIDVGHGHALGIQKALEQQIVLQRIDVGNLQRVADQAPGGRTASRPHRDSLGARMADEIPHDQEISGVAHLLDHLDFVGQARLVLRERFAQQAGLAARFENRHARGKSFARDGFKMTVDGLPFGNLEIGKRVLHRIDLDVAALGDGHGALQRVRKLAEHLRHFFRGLEEKLIGVEFHAVRVAHGLAGLDAQKDFVGV